jgi:hypothetical protein
MDAEDNGGAQDALLSMMDGASAAAARRLFLFTANEESLVTTNMYARPGRIRYVRRYGELPLAVIDEIVADRLADADRWREPLVEYLKTLQLLTVDLVTSVVDEFNMHGDCEAWKAFYNAPPADDIYTLVRIDADTGKEKVVAANLKCSSWHYEVDEPFYVRTLHRTLGTVIEAVELGRVYRVREPPSRKDADAEVAIYEFRSVKGVHKYYSSWRCVGQWAWAHDWPQ